MTTYLWRRHQRECPQTGRAPISLRIEINGFDRAELTTTARATAAEWRAAAQRLAPARGASEPEQQLTHIGNGKLAELLVAAERTYTRLRDQGANPTPKELAALLRGLLRGTPRPQVVRHSLLVVGELYYADAARPERRRRPGTLRSIRYRLDTLSKYVKHLGAAPTLGDITRPWVRGFERWCLTQQLGPATIRQHVELLASVLDLAVGEGHCAANAVRGYAFLSELPAPAKRALSADELTRLEGTRFERAAVQRVADAFLFCCHTGLSPVDYRRFAAAPTDFLHVEAGQLGIQMSRQKTQRYGTVFFSPLFAEAVALLDRYGHRLPVCSGATMSKHLKTVAAACRLQYPDLQHKDARATFSQHRRDRFGAELAAGMAGHSVAVMERHYSSVTAAGIMQGLKGLLPLS